MSRSLWNPNKLFGRLDIRTKLAIAFIGLSGASLALVGWYAANVHLRSLAENATEAQRRGLDTMQKRVQAFLDVVTDDLDLVAELHLVERLLQGDAELLPEGGGATRGDTESFFRDFLASKPHYYRLRLLGADGVELAHAVKVAGSPAIVPAGRWRQTGFRYYTSLIRDLAPRRIAFAPVELRGEPATEPGGGPGSRLSDGSGELVPALSFARPIRGPDGVLTAILVADVYARALFVLLAMTDPRAGESIFLVGPGGEFLFRSDLAEDWNTLLADPDHHKLRQELPDAVATRVLAGGSGVVTEGVDAVVTFTPLLEAPYSSVLGDYVLVSTRPASVVFAPVSEMRRSILGAGALIVLVAGLLALVAAHQFAAPIRALTEGATRLAKGEFDARLEIETNDEIEDLARTFNSMAKALQTREAEVLQQGEQLRHYTDRLETMVEERTTALKKSQQKMVQQEKMVAVGQLAAGLAHELGTPLATILCHAQMAQEELEEANHANTSSQLARAHESLDLVVSQVDRCSQIVRQLLDFSRPSSDARSALRAREVVDVAIELLHHDLERRGVEVEVENASVEARLVGNSNELDQVFVNLLRNAADAMPDGGRISVTIEHDNSNVRFVVVDEGHGIEREAQRHIFDPFFTTKAPGVGTGLGLWVVYNTVTDHGGRIDVDSAPGRGTRITVTLPALVEDSDRGSES